MTCSLIWRCLNNCLMVVKVHLCVLGKKACLYLIKFWITASQQRLNRFPLSLPPPAIHPSFCCNCKTYASVDVPCWLVLVFGVFGLMPSSYIVLKTKWPQGKIRAKSPQAWDHTHTGYMVQKLRQDTEKKVCKLLCISICDFLRLCGKLYSKATILPESVGKVCRDWSNQEIQRCPPAICVVLYGWHYCVNEGKVCNHSTAETGAKKGAICCRLHVSSMTSRHSCSCCYLHLWH